MKKLTAIILHSSFFIFHLAAVAAIPQQWTVETSSIKPARFEGYHGETIEFAATMQTYGKPLAITNDLFGLYWQTNGMGSVYWTAPAVLSNNVMIARWEPSMDVGANVYSCFIGAPGEIYRAAFQLRLRPSPGAVPSELPLPVKTLDFAQVQVLNPPYYSKSETDARIIELSPPADLSPALTYTTAVSNKLEASKQDVIADLASIRSGAALGATAVQPAAISDMETKTHAAATYQPKGSYLTSESDPTVDGKISTHNSSSSAHTDIRTALAEKQPTISDLASIRSGAALGATAVQPAAITDMETQTHASATFATKTALATLSDSIDSLSDAVDSKLAKKVDEYAPSFSTVTYNGVDYTEWTLVDGPNRITLMVNVGGVLTAAAQFNASTKIFISGAGLFDGVAGVSGVSPTLRDKVARESALDGKISTHNSSSSAHADIRQSVSAKQDLLPYPTNEIPVAAIADFAGEVARHAPAPGNYAAVSNSAMNAIHSITNMDANLIYTITSQSESPRFFFTPVGAINPED